ncbi:E3 ubiquitin-protein ligase RNF13 isoform X1 [Spodoptera frugiperda]|uniref:RING-type E3 ubiquitin transferase n=1 Tax=Spodoptera frugiperda TaxID=7108 RepID=A0A9R0EY02_SPOFR|nr:E3 ubiquitin-protein ligase RNF13 isoform X1 [Spodoptera frugiperda]XP_050553652.1 E3 ubiquitin-protein ligase RNF13 isoform X1 [Spodoptera frugiperda]
MLTIALTLHLALLTETFGNVIVYTQETPHVIMEEFRDMPASFGNDLPADGLRGFLVAGEPPDGCGPLPNPPTVDNFTGKWIVLLARYNCSFEVKVRNAQAAGYDCAIVHNVNSSDLETMSAKNPEGIEIPSVFVSDLAGLLLGDEYLYTSGFYIMVNGDLPFNINTHLLLPFAIVVVLCLLVILIFMIVKCIKDRRRARRHRLPSRSLKKIPTCKFSKGDPYDTCAICLDDYQEGERLRVLPCAHAYHAVCIDPWLTQNKRVCPVCKRRVFAAGERRRLHTDSDDTDTEPLLNDNTATQGGTFEEQSVNPFVRATEFMRRLRRDNQQRNNAEAASQSEDNDESNNVNDDTVETGDREALLPSVSPVGTSAAPAVPAVTTVASERRGRRARRARSHSAHTARPTVQPTVQPSRARDTTLLISDTHSINTESTGEIGVAALPAVPQSSSIPRNLDL